MKMVFKITQECETKNFYVFKREGCSQTYDVDKRALYRALCELDYWQNGPRGTDFTAKLYELIAKADENNFEKFFKGFPVRTTAYILWYNSAHKEELFKKYMETRR